MLVKKWTSAELAFCGLASLVLLCVGCFTIPDSDIPGRTDGTPDAQGDCLARIPGGGYLAFDGTDDFVEIPDSDPLSLGNEATIEAWINRNDNIQGNHSLETIVAKWGNAQTSGDDEFALDFRLDTQEIRWVTSGSQGEDILVGPISTLPPPGIWFHVAATLGNGHKSIYVDGELLVSSSVTAFLDRNTNEPLLIGAQDRISVEGVFDGSIDEVRVWNVMRSAQQIRASLDIAVSESTPGLIGYWRFNEAAGDPALLDSSSFGGFINNGVLGGMSGETGEGKPRRQFFQNCE
ncbi:MAG: LamG domain-containing protein [Planctomycetes bacterium]|nr:LamG domain-containing protein [Planctomycetota bacterium]